MKELRQLFFIAPNGYPQVKATGLTSTHGWCAEGDDPSKDTVIGVVEMRSGVDPEQVIDKLEAAGIMWLPNHLTGEKIDSEHYEALKKHGVQASHTTAQAMSTVFAKSGFPPHNPRRKRF
jgi:hypothetical protein